MGVLSSCRGNEPSATPVLLRPAVVETVTPTVTALPITTATTEQFPSPTAVATYTPFPSITQIRPDQTQLFRLADNLFPREANAPDPSEGIWRPPPYDVPLSLHYNDHYWLIRPIPSGYRNYSLEWFPYGNDVLIPEYAPYRIHHGLDFPNDTGTPILAASSGTVIWAGPLPSTRDGVNYYGNTVIIEHDWQWQEQKVYTLYAHTLELFVEVGDDVQQGQLLAGIGQSGAVSGAHLHLEVRVGGNNRFNSRNPELWLAPYSGWGTLAGRFTDKRGRPITNAFIAVELEDGSGPTRTRRTYTYDGVTPDEVWNENFVVADLPAGRYTLELTSEADGVTYERTVEVLPGRTNFISIQADFTFIPTPTPIPSPTITGTLPISPLLPITPSVPITTTLP